MSETHFELRESPLAGPICCAARGAPTSGACTVQQEDTPATGLAHDPHSRAAPEYAAQYVRIQHLLRGNNSGRDFRFCFSLGLGLYAALDARLQHLLRNRRTSKPVAAAGVSGLWSLALKGGTRCAAKVSERAPMDGWAQP